MGAFRCLVVLLAFLVLGGRAPGEDGLDAAAGHGLRWEVDPAWPARPADITWAAVPGLAVDAQDHVYLFNRNQPAVQVYSPDGALVRAWATPNSQGAHSIRIDPEGNVWVTDFREHVVEKYSPQGEALLTLGERGRGGSGEKHFAGPTDVAFLPSGELFVADGYGNRRIVHFDAEGNYVNAWGEEGSGPGQFALPHAIVADSQGRLYVADRNNARIQVFDTGGTLLAVWEDLVMPWGLHVTAADELWVCGSSPVEAPDGAGWVVSPPPDQILMKLSDEGSVLLRMPLATIQDPPGRPGEVDWVHAVAVDSRNNIYLGDIEGQRAQKFTPPSP